VLACAEQHLGDVPAIDGPHKKPLHSRRRKRNPVVQKGVPVVAEEAEVSANTRDHWGCSLPKRWSAQSKCAGDREIAVMVTAGSPRWSQPGDDGPVVSPAFGPCPQSVTGLGPE